MARNRPIQQGILGVTWLILIFVCRSGCNAPTIRSKHGRGKASGTPAGQFAQVVPASHGCIFEWLRGWSRREVPLWRGDRPEVAATVQKTLPMAAPYFRHGA